MDLHDDKEGKDSLMQKGMILLVSVLVGISQLLLPPSSLSQEGRSIFYEMPGTDGTETLKKS